jgi:hypothetical protein
MKNISHSIFIYAMIRYTRHSNKEYIVIDGSLEIDNLIIPIQYQVNVNDVKIEDHSKVFRIVSSAFDRNISFNRPKQQPTKPWWKIW